MKQFPLVLLITLLVVGLFIGLWQKISPTLTTEPSGRLKLTQTLLNNRAESLGISIDVFKEDFGDKGIRLGYYTQVQSQTIHINKACWDGTLCDRDNLLHVYFHELGHLVNTNSIGMSSHSNMSEVYADTLGFYGVLDIYRDQSKDQLTKRCRVMAQGIKRPLGHRLNPERSFEGYMSQVEAYELCVGILERIK